MIAPQPLVTLMIPCFNQASVVAAAIESAMAQDYPNLEIVISDDCSSDNTREVVAKYLSDNRIKYYRNEKNIGRVCNYKKTIFEYATGDWVLNIDGDDKLVDSSYVSKAIELALTDSEIVLVFARLRWVDLEKNTSYDSSAKHFERVMFGNDLLMRYWRIPEGIANLTALYKRNHAIEINLHNNNHMFNDSESFFKIIAGSKVGFVNTIAGCWYKHTSNYSGSLDIEKRFATFHMIEDPYHYYLQTNKMYKSDADVWRTQMTSRLMRDHICFFIDGGRKTEALEFAYKCYNKFGAKITAKAIFSFRVIFRFISTRFYNMVKDVVRTSH